MGLLKEETRAGSGTGGSRHEKHVMLNEAINEMNSNQRSLEILLNDINPRPQPENPEDEMAPNVTLADILNNGPDRIRNSCDRMRGLISELREELF